MRETRWDCVDWTPPNLPFETRPSIFDDKPHRLESGSINVYRTDSGTIRKRWRTDQWSGVLGGGKRIRKMWLYETLPISSVSPPQQYAYFIFSVQDTSTLEYSLYYKLFSDADTASLTPVTALRGSNNSKKVHHITVSKGLAYVKSFPASGTDKYGTIILDGSSGSIVVRPWGIPGPTEPAHISGEVIRLTASVTASATTFNTTNNSAMPATPFDLWIGYEKVTVTAKPTTTSLTVTRGAGGTTAEAHDANEVLIYRDWDASDHQVEVRLGWRYAFSYVSITGQVSNRSDIEYNPDLMPSNTGPFYDLIPKIDLTLDSWFYNDTTTYPYLNIYRTTDGGGTFYFLEQVANPGTSTYTYEDDSFGTGASSTTYNDPIPDLKLDTARYAPSLTSNSVPTTVNPPSIVGADAVSQSCYAVTTYAARIWIAIDHYLHFSSREETRDGIGEECFPSGNLGNFFILDAGIVGLAATRDALYVITTNDVYKVSGTTLDTFTVTKIVNGIGGFTTDGCAKAYRNNVAFLTKEKELALIENDIIRIVSKPLTDDYLIGLPVSVEYFRNNRYEWIIVAASTGDYSTGTDGYIYIYDLLWSERENDNRWSPPWRVPMSAFVCTQSIKSNTNGMFCAFTHTVGGYTVAAKFYAVDTITPKYDVSLSVGGTVSTAGFATALYFGPVKAPSGNHLNALNAPAKDVNFYGFLVTCEHAPANSSQIAPGIIINNKPSNETASSAVQEPRVQIDDTNGQYITYLYPYNIEVKQIRPYTITLAADLTDFNILSIIWVFDAKANP